MSRNRLLRYASYLKDYCLEHEFCHGCKLPKTKDKDCICPRNWIIPEISSYPELISEEEFSKSLQTVDKISKNIGNWIIRKNRENLKNQKFHAFEKEKGKWLAVRFYEDTFINAYFENPLDCRRFLSGWLESDIEDFKEFEKKEKSKETSTENKSDSVNKVDFVNKYLTNNIRKEIFWRVYNAGQVIIDKQEIQNIAEELDVTQKQVKATLKALLKESIIYQVYDDGEILTDWYGTDLKFEK